MFKVNDRQYIEVTPTLASESDDKLIQIGFETKDARKLRDYLAAKGVTVPAKAGKDDDGNYSFVVKDPEGHQVEFVEYVKGSLHSRHFGEGLSTRRISDHMLHVGVHVKDAGAQDRFYKDILGFRFQWKGGPQDDRVDWISMMTPDGNNWIEYMISRDPPTPQQLGVWHHVCVGTLDIQRRIQDSCRQGLYAAARADDRARWTLAAPTLRQAQHADRGNGSQAGSETLLFGEPGSLHQMRYEDADWRYLPWRSRRHRAPVIRSRSRSSTAWRLKEPVSGRRYTVVELQSRSGETGYGEGGPVPAAEIVEARAAIQGRRATESEFVRARAGRHTRHGGRGRQRDAGPAGSKSRKVPIYQFLGGPRASRRGCWPGWKAPTRRRRRRRSNAPNGRASVPSPSPRSSATDDPRCRNTSIACRARVAKMQRWAGPTPNGCSTARPP